jgi:hypothetical protein
MLTPETTHSSTSKSLFLAEPSPLPELDNWVDEYVRSKRRFTFTEVEVLKHLWERGEDIRLREDSRFREANTFERAIEPQWRLALHIEANQALYELLLDEDWDGHDLFHRLEEMDQATADSTFHVFSLGDERLHLSHDENNLYSLSLRANVDIVELTTEQKRTIDLLAPRLFAHFPAESRKPWSISSIMEEFIRWSDPTNALDGVVPAALENWLLHQEEWARVGLDLWLPKNSLPAMAAKHRYAVPPILSATNEINTALPTLKEEENSEQGISQVVDQPVTIEQQISNKRVCWRITLRSHHINEGIIPVPKQARSLYPLAPKLARIIAVPGLWFTDESDMTVWLDRTKNQLFGHDLQDQFAFLEAGELLEIDWTVNGLVFRTLGVDQKVAEEESRLIDLSSLTQLRSTLLESYRASLRAIMSEQKKALFFQALYEALCDRQQHKPNRATVRSVLSSSPEFVFIKAEGKWALNPTIASEVGAKSLRRFTLVAKEVEGDIGETKQKAASLTEIIAKNRQQISTLRSLYSSDRNLNEPPNL